jgi:hypothetical protein
MSKHEEKDRKDVTEATSKLDVDIEKYSFSDLKTVLPQELSSLDGLSNEEIETLTGVGVNLKDTSKVGKYLQYGHDEFTLLPQIDGLEIMPIGQALEQYPEIKSEYFWKAVDLNKDKYTRAVSETIPRGFFIRVKRGIKIEDPLQVGLFMHKEMSSMSLHNLVILEDDSKLHLITGCTAGCDLNAGLHVAVSEHFVGKNAKFINTMVHSWGQDFIVRPKSTTIVDDNGMFVSNYYTVRPPKHIDMDPFTLLKGENSSAKYMTVIVCLPDTYTVSGGTVHMTGKNSASEYVSRTVNHGGVVVQSGLLIGDAEGTRAHIDCSGLMLSTSGTIEAVPGLRAMHPDAKMSHEASIGKIDMGEVYYLQSKGLDEMQAIALIVRGFLDIGIEVEGLSPEIEKMIKEISELSGHGENRELL